MKPRIEKTGISKSTRPRDVPRAFKHLEFIRSLPCCVCAPGAMPFSVVPHHLMRIGDGRPRGQYRNADRWTIPMCFQHHLGLHELGNEEKHLTAKGIDGRGLAQALWKVSGDYDAGLRIVERCKKVERRDGMEKVLRTEGRT